MQPDYQKVLREVQTIFSNFGISHPPVNPVDIARNMGIKVIFARFDKDHNTVAGFYDFEEDAIYVNKDEFPLRQTFTIAHELGHRILHSEWAKSAEYKVLLRNGGNSEDPIEKEANSFAANLLVPKFMLDQYWKELSPERLSELFAVSVPVITNRLNFEYGA